MPTHRMTTPIFSAKYWALKNPILLRGERGLAEFYDEDGHVTRIREKVGDGVMGADRVITGTHWNDLPWITTGEKGDKGDTGPMPKHDWSGTALRFENPDGTWGNRVDLKGEPGNRANAEPATTTTLGGVMPATGLRVNIEGYEYVALGWDKEKCYPDPIVVAYDGSPWLWLQESGVGTEAGVRTPGTGEAGNYWRQIANVVDIPKPGIGLELDTEANAYDVKYGNESGTALEGNGTALSSKKLQTPRTITVELGQEGGEAFDGTADITPGVSGILGPANGGTGVNSLQALAQALQQTGLIGGQARRLFTFQYTGPSAQSRCVKLTGLTPGKQLIVTNHPNEDPNRGDSAIRASTNGWSLCSGLWIGKLDSEPIIYYPGQYKRPDAAQVIATFDLCYSGGTSSPDHNSVGASAGISWGAYQLTNYVPYLIRSSTVRLLASVADDYPRLVFWEY